MGTVCLHVRHCEMCTLARSTYMRLGVGELPPGSHQVVNGGRGHLNGQNFFTL